MRPDFFLRQCRSRHSFSEDVHDRLVVSGLSPPPGHLVTVQVPTSLFSVVVFSLRVQRQGRTESMKTGLGFSEVDLETGIPLKVTPTESFSGTVT